MSGNNYMCCRKNKQGEGIEVFKGCYFRQQCPGGPWGPCGRLASEEEGKPQAEQEPWTGS